MASGSGREADAFIATRKHEESWSCGVPALNSVGDAWMNHFSDMRLYLFIGVCAKSGSGVFRSTISAWDQAQRARLKSSSDVGTVNPNCNSHLHTPTGGSTQLKARPAHCKHDAGGTHEHVLRPFDSSTMDLEKVRALERPEAKVVKVKIAVVDDRRVELGCVVHHHRVRCL